MIFIFLAEDFLMTSEELGDVLRLKESYIRTHWPRIVRTYEKQDIKLYKRGRGQNADYGVKFPWDISPVWDTDELEIMI